MILTAILAIAFSPFVVLAAFFATEIAFGINRGRPRTVSARDPSAVIVVPAHNEAKVIEHALRSLADGLGDRMSILVVADNCSDDTARLARQAGHRVIERNDECQRGKGFALAFAAAELAATAPEVVVVIDADCEIDHLSLRAIVNEAAASNRPCQAVNLIRPRAESSPLVQISNFAFFVKNSIRQRGLQRLAGRVHLTGTGMAMPFFLFQRAEEVGGCIVEDLAFGIKLAEAGYPPMLVDRATVWSDASSQDGTLTQRRRWEGGFLSQSFRQGSRLIRRGIASFEVWAMLAGLDLLVPPLALFAFVNLTVLTIGVLTTAAFGLTWWPVIIHCAVLAVALCAVAATWFGEGRKFLSVSALLRIPLYVAWKLPLYAAIARRGGPREWLRPGR